MTQEIIIKKQKLKLITTLLSTLIMSIIFLILMIYGMGIGTGSFNLITFFIGLVLTVIMVYFSYKIFLQVKDKAPALVVNDDGIYENSSASSIGFIPWDRIDNVYVKRSMIGNFLCIQVDEDYLDEINLDKAKRKVTVSNKKLGFEIATVDLKLLKKAEIEAIIDKFDESR